MDGPFAEPDVAGEIPIAREGLLDFNRHLRSLLIALGNFHANAKYHVDKTMKDRAEVAKDLGYAIPVTEKEDRERLMANLSKQFDESIFERFPKGHIHDQLKVLIKLVNRLPNLFTFEQEMKLMVEMTNLDTELRNYISKLQGTVQHSLQELDAIEPRI